MKKVLFISNVPVPYRMEFFRQLSKYVDLTVIFESRSGKFKYNYDLDSTGFKIIFSRPQRKKIYSTYIKEFKLGYDYIIIADWLHSFVAISYLKMFNIPYYVEVDGAILHYDNIFKRSLKKYLLKDAKGYFSTSDSSDKYFFRYGALNTEIIRYPFSSIVERDILEQPLQENEKIMLKEKLGFDTKKKLIIGVGRYIHRKGFDTLILAMKNLKDTCELVLVGGKPTEEYKQLILSMNITNVKFIDFITKSELFLYYRAADVFVLPTREEVWGLVINEAMSQGLPIITTDNCVAGSEMVVNEENGYIFHVGDYEKLEKYIEKVVFDKEKQIEMSKRSLNIISDYTIERMVEAHVSFFRSDENEE